MSNELVKFNEARRAVQAARSIDEVLEIKNKMDALKLYVKQQGESLEMQNQCAEISVRASRRAGELLREMPKNGGAKGQLNGDVPKGTKLVGGNIALPPTDDTPTLSELGIEKMQSSRFQAIAAVPEEIFEAVIRETVEAQKELTASAMVKLSKSLTHQEDIQRQREEINNNGVTPPTGLYGVISVDPPWPYGSNYNAVGRRSASPYPEMSLLQIVEIELPAAADCVLWFWTTHKFMRHSFEILDAWGFRDVMILTWVKDRMGTGAWLRSQTEFCIMAVKGKPTIDLTNQVTILYGEMREHSRKPESFYQLVDGLCVGYKLDYFSREQRDGWVSFGNDTERF